MPGWARSFAAAALFATALACGGAPMPGEVAMPPIAPIAAAADPPGAEDAIGAYLQDCHHVFASEADTDWEGENHADECLWFEFDQNCSEDRSGCWDKGQACQSACGGACGDCQQACAGSCDDCKTACNGDSTCLRTCAEARAACRDSCLGGKETCTAKACPAEESACEALFEATVAEKCPRCDDMRSCENEAREQEPYDPTFCHKDFPDAPTECYTWCAPYF